MPTPKKAASAKNALSKPVQPDAALAAVVGRDPLPRTELTKKVWEYIRKHELQDPKDKRNIRADEKLLAVFDGKKIVSMFEMTRLVNGHLVGSRAAYDVLDGLWVGLGRARAPAGLVACVCCNKASNRNWANGTEAAIRPNKPDRLRAGFWLFNHLSSLIGPGVFDHLRR